MNAVSFASTFMTLGVVVGLLQPVAHAAELTWNVREKGSKTRPVQIALTGLPSVSNPFDPDQADLIATITTPSSATYEIPMFW